MRHIYAVQLTSIFKEKDFDNRTIIAMAASTGNIGIFNTVFSAADDLLSKTEVRQSLCLTLNDKHYNVSPTSGKTKPKYVSSTRCTVEDNDYGEGSTWPYIVSDDGFERE